MPPGQGLGGVHRERIELRASSDSAPADLFSLADSAFRILDPVSSEAISFKILTTRHDSICDRVSILGLVLYTCILDYRLVLDQYMD